MHEKAVASWCWKKLTFAGFGEKTRRAEKGKGEGRGRGRK